MLLVLSVTETVVVVEMFDRFFNLSKGVNQVKVTTSASSTDGLNHLPSRLFSTPVSQKELRDGPHRKGGTARSL